MRKGVVMTEEIAEMLRRRYSDESNASLAEELGIAAVTVSKWARKLGLRKSEKFMEKARWKGMVEIWYAQVTGKNRGGARKGGTSGSFGRRKLTAKEEEKRKKAIRDTAWEERKRILRGEERKTRWSMRDYSKPKEGGKWRKA